jgi:hypothetical protein
VKAFGGYRQGRQVRNLVPKKENIAKQCYYLKPLFENHALPEAERKWEVYTYESYFCYKHYNINNKLIWDPNNKQDVMVEKANTKSASIFQNTTFIFSRL